MAGALVGGSFLSACLQVLFDRLASHQVVDFFKGQKLQDRLLKKLKTKMIIINKVLDDAEDKQHSDPYVKQWLDELKDAVYEAEDFLDEISYEVLRSEMEAGLQTSLEKLHDFASSRNPFKMGKEERLEEILERLEDLVEQKDALGLINGVGEQPSLQRTPTTSIVDESATYGRHADKEVILKWLLSDDVSSNNPNVLAIVGMAGLGKTTLAQLVYNDSRAQEHFNTRAWVCVSEEFIVSKVTKEILEEITKKPSKTVNLNQLQGELKDKLMGKFFLLVLDDVWNENYLDWDHLLAPLKFGQRGSKIVVTTRSKRAARIMQTVPASYQLHPLQDDDCWLLFKRHAFIEKDSNAHPDLERIGRQIIKKCEGLPLAIKVLGGILRSKGDPSEWTKVLKSDMWDLQCDGLLPVLKLSYHYLPSHLKRCFAYCATFPKDYEFVKKQLIHLWMVEGLLIQPRMNMEVEELEEAGEECFNGLVSRSFFQQSPERESFVMHSLINDLAKFISREFCFRLGVDKLCEVTRRTRQLWLRKGAKDEISKIHIVQGLRTILIDEWAWLDSIDGEEMNNLLPTFRRLRVLLLCYYDMVKLPDSIENLIHLRHLDLSNSSITELPNSIGSLYNLETLILYWCRQLVGLPASIVRLVNLCQLDIRGTTLQGMPPQMGRLKRLRELTYFIVGKQSGTSVKELGELQCLRGQLCILNLRNVVQVEEAMEANLKGKKSLEGLELIWSGRGDENSLHERSVLEHLQPHVKIKWLSIKGYAGTRFPHWVGDYSFSNMVELKLEGCRYCSSLPPLGQLGSLRCVSIKEFDGIVAVGSEFYGDCKKPSFGCLEVLRFISMLQWHEWIPYAADTGDDEEEEAADADAFPLLKVLKIIDCPNLRGTLPSHLPSLTELEISGCDKLASFPRAPEIIEVLIEDNSRKMVSLKSPSGLQCLEVHKWHSPDSPLDVYPGYEQMMATTNSISLEFIYIQNWDYVKCFQLDVCPRLQTLVIYDCPNLESLSAASEAPLEHFKVLKIQDCSNFKWLPECMASLFPSLVKLHINNCPELESFPKYGLPSNIESLQVFNCYNLTARRMQSLAMYLHGLPNLSHLGIGGDVESFPPEEMLLPSTLTSLEISHFPNLKLLDSWGLQALSSLESLKIEKCPKLQLPEELQLPCTLASLTIDGLKNLQSLDYWRLQHLTSLRELKIHNCLQLRSIPKEGLPSSLQELYICRCPLLEKRCERETGDDWPKISFIPKIYIT